MLKTIIFEPSASQLPASVDFLHPASWFGVLTLWIWDVPLRPDFQDSFRLCAHGIDVEVCTLCANLAPTLCFLRTQPSETKGPIIAGLCLGLSVANLFLMVCRLFMNPSFFFGPCCPQGPERAKSPFCCIEQLLAAAGAVGVANQQAWGLNEPRW